MFDLDADGFMKPASAGVLPKLPSGTARPPKPVFIAELERGVVGDGCVTVFCLVGLFSSGRKKTAF